MPKKPGEKAKRILCIPMTDDEMAALLEAETDPHMKKALGEMLQGARANPAKRQWYANWKILLKRERNQPETLIGSFCFKGEPKGHEAELGYEISEPFRRRGYGAMAVRWAMQWAFDNDAELYYIMAETEPDNEASQALLRKLGFVPAGEGEEGPRFEKEREPVSYLSIYMCMGMSLGLCIGTAADNLAIGMSIGMCIGVALGAALDANAKKKLMAVRAQREPKKEGAEE